TDAVGALWITRPRAHAYHSRSSLGRTRPGRLRRRSAGGRGPMGPRCVARSRQSWCDTDSGPRPKELTVPDAYARPAGRPELLGRPVPPPPTPPAPAIPPATPSPYEETSSDSGGVKDAAKDEAANVAQNVSENAKKVAGTATEEAKSTVAEA